MFFIRGVRKTSTRGFRVPQCSKRSENIKRFFSVYLDADVEQQVMERVKILVEPVTGRNLSDLGMIQVSSCSL